MKTLKEKAVDRWNKICFDICIEHCSVGTDCSELFDENVTIKELVAEAKYWLSCYYEDGHARCEMKFEDEDGRKSWLSETGKLKRFITAFEVN